MQPLFEDIFLSSPKCIFCISLRYGLLYSSLLGFEMLPVLAASEVGLRQITLIARLKEPSICGSPAPGTQSLALGLCAYSDLDAV